MCDVDRTFRLHTTSLLQAMRSTGQAWSYKAWCSAVISCFSTALIGAFRSLLISDLLPRRSAVARLSCCCVSWLWASTLLEFLFHYPCWCCWGEVLCELPLWPCACSNKGRRFRACLQHRTQATLKRNKVYRETNEKLSFYFYNHMVFRGNRGVLGDAKKKRVTVVQMWSHKCVNKSLRGLRTEEFPNLANFIQAMKSLAADLMDIDILESNQEPQFRTLSRGWTVESPTVMESIAIFDNWWPEPTTKNSVFESLINRR